VAYHHAAAGELIRHGEDGLLAPLADEAMFCRMAVRLAADGPQMRALGARARETAQRQDWGRIVALVEDEYAGAMLLNSAIGVRAR
jgi:glycosyltransferase involved in cell wall biosynthesis